MSQTSGLDWGGSQEVETGLNSMASQSWKSAEARTCRRPEHLIREGCRSSNLGLSGLVPESWKFTKGQKWTES